jgi:hypothetical protein
MAYIHNQASVIKGNTLFNKILGQKKAFGHLHIIESLCHVWVESLHDKFMTKAEPTFLVCHGNGQRGYRRCKEKTN